MWRALTSVRGGLLFGLAVRAVAVVACAVGAVRLSGADRIFAIVAGVLTALSLAVVVVRLTQQRHGVEGERDLR